MFEKIFTRNKNIFACKRCGDEVAWSNLKYDSRDNDAVCSECFEILEKKYTRQKKNEPVVTEQKMAKYICGDCKYNFSLKESSKIARMCPYCSKPNLMVDKGDADRLLQDITETGMPYQWAA